MSAPPPLTFDWDGEAMRPRHPRVADQHFVVGENYQLEVREDRSAPSHRHYFSAIKEAHDSLPDEVALRFPTPEALRKHALIRAGFRDERSIVCASKAEAQRLAIFVRPMDDYAWVVVEGATLTVYTAKSQSTRAMGKEAFQMSKDAVLDAIARLIGTSRADLEGASAA